MFICNGKKLDEKIAHSFLMLLFSCLKLLLPKWVAFETGTKLTSPWLYILNMFCSIIDLGLGKSNTL